MAYSATLLLALVSITAASVLPQQDRVSHLFSRRNTYNPYNNDNNKINHNTLNNYNNNNNNNYNNYNPNNNYNDNNNNYNPYDNNNSNNNYNNNNNYNTNQNNNKNYNPYNNYQPFNNNNNKNYNPYNNNNNNNDNNNYNPYNNNNNNNNNYNPFNNNNNNNNNNYNPYDNNNNNNYNPNSNNNNNNYNYNNNHQGYQQDIEKQQFVLQVLSNLGKGNSNHYVARIGSNFNPQQNVNRFYNQGAIQHFFRNYRNNNFLPRNEVFSPTNQEHQNQAAQLFNFLFSSQDWNTFKQAAAWARLNFNHDQFAYAFIAAVFNHPSTQGVVLPPLYEVVPHAFVPAPALQEIFNAKLQGQNHVTVYANYTNQNENNRNYDNENSEHNNNNGQHNAGAVFADDDGSQQNNAGVHENPENRVSYFTEDVGVNAFHAGFHAQNPPFFGSNYNNNFYDNIYNVNNNNNNNNGHNRYYNRLAVKRGEAFYFAHQQLYARYVLERLSNNLPIPQPINFDDKIEPGYNPNLEYANGQAVPARPPNTYFQQQQNENSNNNNNAHQPNNNQAQNPQVYEQRLQEAAESGIVVNADGSETKLNSHNGVAILANLAAAPANSPNPDFYGDYFSAAKNAIGNIVDPNNQNGVAPGAVANYATAARDPAYYQFLAKLNQIFRNFQNKQGPYQQYQLSFPGVQIQSFDVSRLVTYFDSFYVNVNNAIKNNYDNNVNDYNDNNNNNYQNNYNPIKNYNNNKYNKFNNNNNNYNYDNNNNYNNYNDEHNSNNNNQNFNGNYNVEFQRLTNRPFNYRLNVQSQRSTNAVVRVFIGPKFDSNGQQFTLPQASEYFVQLDQFSVQLHNGQNVIERNSYQSPFYVHDQPSYYQLWNRIQQVRQSQQPFFAYQGQRHHFGFPQRSQLPKGKESGQEFIFYAIITEANSNSDNESNNYHNNYQNFDNNYNNNNDFNYNNNNNNNNFNNYNNDNNYNYYHNRNYVQSQDFTSVGFPFDRPIEDSNYNTPNQYFKTVTIYHKSQHN